MRAAGPGAAVSARAGGEDPAALYQIVVAAPLDDAAGFENEDSVHVADRAEPVGDYHAGDAQPFERLLDGGPGAVVEGAGGLVEKQDAWPAGTETRRRPPLDSRP